MPNVFSTAGPGPDDGQDGGPSSGPRLPRIISIDRPARTHERKRHVPLRVRRWALASPLGRFFTGGVELDAGIDRERLDRFTGDFVQFSDELRISPRWGTSVEIKFRRLGRHRADGLYYPVQRILVLDLTNWSSFAHEFGHLMDYRPTPVLPYQRTLSGREDFAGIRTELLGRMRDDGRGDPRLSGGRGRLSWGYFASATECFARAFEQFVAETMPPPCLLAHDAPRYRADPLFFRTLPPEVIAYFRRLLAAGPP